MKLRILLASGLVLTLGAIAYLSLAPHKAAADGEELAVSQENPTVKAFVKEFKDSAQMADEIFADSADSDKVIYASKEGGFYSARADASPVIAASADEKGSEIDGSGYDLNSKDAATVGELKKALKEARE